MKPANFAPVYAALYPELAEVTRSHGYALAIHGSMARDFDLVCVPWADTVSSPDDVVNAITTKFAIRRSGDQWTKKNHGRIACTINVEFGQCAIDLSFMPTLAAERARVVEALTNDVNELTRRGLHREALTLRTCIQTLPPIGGWKHTTAAEGGSTHGADHE